MSVSSRRGRLAAHHHLFFLMSFSIASTEDIRMSDNDANMATRNRREFLTGTVMAGGAAAVASVIPGDAGAATEKLTPATIALLPTPAQMQDFIALPDDHPIVMVNLLKFKPNGGQAEYAK